MKLAIILLLAALTHAADIPGAQKTENDKPSFKRALDEGKANVERRTPAPVSVEPTALPSVTPGIVYSDGKNDQNGRTEQETYVTPLPQIAKISDVLTGQGPSYHAAIASHLYSPISIYQTRVPTPTTYEISAPVPSRLAYAEKISYQQPVQYQQLNEVVDPKTSQRFVVTPQEPNVIYQPPPSPRVPQVYPQIYHAQPRFPYSIQRPVTYVQENFNQAAVPGIIYYQQNGAQQGPTLREFKNSLPPKPVEKQPAPSAPEQANNIQPQGAVSYASFSLGLPAPAPEPKPQQPAQSLPPQQQTQPQKFQQEQPQQQILQQTQYQQNQIQQVPQQNQYQQSQIQQIPQQTQYKQSQIQNQILHNQFPTQQLQFQTVHPQNQQQFPAQQNLVYDFKQPRLQEYQTVFPPPPIVQVPQPLVYHPTHQSPQYFNVQQPQYQVQQYQTRPLQYQVNQPNTQPQLLKYQAAPANNLIQTTNLERPIFFKPESVKPFRASVFPPPNEYYGKYAHALLGVPQNL